MGHTQSRESAESESHEEWFRFNYDLEQEALDSRLNEDYLVQRLQRLWELPPVENRVFWLGLARLNELALLCAGTYADACEFSAAGDLLLNPRLILIHIKGRLEPLVKNRHQALTRQMAPLAPANRNIINWIKENTRLEVRRQALLPHIMDMLTRSGCLGRTYLDSAKARCDRIAGTISLLNANRITGPAELCAALVGMSPGERAELKQDMCFFDRRIFSALGREMHQIMHYGQVNSKYTIGNGADPSEISNPDALRSWAPGLGFDSAHGYHV